MLLAAVALAAAVSGFNSPSGTLIVDIKTPFVEGWSIDYERPWTLTVTDLHGMQIDTKEYHPELPGFVLESLNKTAKASFSYTLTAHYCSIKEQCREQRFSGKASIDSSVKRK